MGVPGDGGLRVVSPCSPGLVAASERLAVEIFGPTIPWERYIEWYAQNPEMLITVVNDTDEVLGYVECVPLHPARARAFLAGRCGEADIQANVILSPEQVTAADSLLFLIPGIAVRNAGTYAGAQRASLLLQAVGARLNAARSRGHDVFVIANGATAEGIRFLERAGADELAPGHLRSDGLPLYGWQWRGGWRRKTQTAHS